MPSRLLVDSGFLFALYDQNDRYHTLVQTVREREAGVSIIPDIVLVEAAFLARRAGGVPGVFRFLDALQEAGDQLETIRYAILPARGRSWLSMRMHASTSWTAA